MKATISCWFSLDEYLYNTGVSLCFRETSVSLRQVTNDCTKKLDEGRGI